MGFSVGRLGLRVLAWLRVFGCIGGLGFRVFRVGALGVKGLEFQGVCCVLGLCVLTWRLWVSGFCAVRFRV